MAWKFLLITLSASTVLVPRIYAITPDDTNAELYINTYHQLAINEMYRLGVPASITLAQGMLESSFGQSELARSANNHFGIKCHKDWGGESYYHSSNEDHPTEGMQKAKSCFRRYETVAVSYADHSNHLRSRTNYQSLFELSVTDYHQWAEGLVKAGYATDRNYASKLISVIEKHHLGRYDQQMSNSNDNIMPKLETDIATKNIATVTTVDIIHLKERVARLERILTEAELYQSELKADRANLQKQIDDLRQENKNLRMELNQKIAVLDETIHSQLEVIVGVQTRLTKVETVQQAMLKVDPLSNYFNSDGTAKSQIEIFPVRSKNAAGIFYQGGHRTTVIVEGKKLLDIAEEYNIPYRDLLRFNDLEEEVALPNNCYIYLEPKANMVEEAGQKQHQVRIGETMHSISQLYGVKLSKLYQRNSLSKNEEPEVGEFIFLNSNNPQKVKLRNQPTLQQANFGGGGSKSDR